MRIAFVSDNYPGRGEAGGIATYSRVMARCLGRQGHNVHVFAGGGDGVFADDDVTVHLVPLVGDATSMSRVMARSVQTDGPFDVLESPEFKALGSGAIGRRDIARLLTVRLHGAETMLGHRRDIWRGLAEDPERAVALAADVVTSPTEFAVDMSDRQWGTQLRQRTVIVPNPGPELVPLSAPQPRYDVAFFGRLEPRKGIDVLVDVLDRVDRRLAVVVAGADHPWGSGLTGLGLLRAGQSRVSYCGVLDHAEVMATLSQARVALVPSRRESFGLTLLEAMSVGVPAIAADIAPFRELVGDSAGVTLVPTDQPGRWAAELIRLLDHPELARDQARRAQRRAQDFRPAVVAGALLEAWHPTKPVPASTRPALHDAVDPPPAAWPASRSRALGSDQAAG